MLLIMTARHNMNEIACKRCDHSTVLYCLSSFILGDGIILTHKFIKRFTNKNFNDDSYEQLNVV
jgi:hypothetical protein